MTKNFFYSASFDDLKLNPIILLENSGQFDSQQSSELLQMASKAYQLGKNLAEISCEVVLTDIEIDGDQIFAGSCHFNPGKKITMRFSTASIGAFFICTAGKKFEEAAHTMMAEGQLIDAYYIDLLGSLTVETAMDRFQKILASEMSAEGLSISNRYSPGYCDWKVSEQHELFKLFTENRCGVTLSDSALMSPIKSVSGIIGVGKQVRFQDHHCELCNSNTCIYRNINPRKK